MKQKELDLGRLKSLLLLDNPFFGTLAYHLEWIEDRSVETLQTNGVYVKVNPDFLASLPHAQRLGVMAHEVLHPALQHLYRRDGRDLREWNEACDYVINLQLKDAGFELPEGVLIDEQFRNMSAEQVFSKRRTMQPPPLDPKDQEQEQEQEQGGEEEQESGQSEGEGDEDESESAGDGEGDEEGEGEGDGPGGSMPGCPTGEFIDGPETTGAEGKELTAEDWEKIVAEAEVVAARQGDLPGGVGRAIKEAREPRVDWKGTLREFIAQTVETDWSWNRPNRRLVSRGLYFPGMIKDNTGELVIAVDTSGSTWSILEQFNDELQGILRDARPEKIHVVYCDAQVQRTEEYGPDDAVKLEMHGGGGTEFQPVFDWMEEQQVDPLAVVYLTDLYGPAPTKEPTCPVLWVTPEWSRANEPFGQIVRIP